MREAILDPAAFGPGAIVERTPRLIETARFDEMSLAGADVVVLSAVIGGLDACERYYLRQFVDQGGGLFFFTNRAGDQMAPVLDTGLAVGCGGGDMDFASGSHPVLDGPFGALIGSWRFIYRCEFESLPADATPIVVDGAAIIGAAFDDGAGRAVVINEEEWAMSAGGCPSSPFWGPTGRVFALNTLAFIAPDPGFTFAPIPFECRADLTGDCQLDIFDFFEFQNLFALGDPIVDFTGDGVLDFFDFLAFQNEFAAGCP
ncbi:MAG: GC-type dockerin domain-anchored protein [Phycisphaerales bacterium JB039]